MNRLNKAISDVAYILDSLILLRQIQQTGDCNICKNRDCGYMPKVGRWSDIIALFTRQKVSHRKVRDKE